MAGTGKSTAACAACRHFDSDGLPARLCAFFFCSRQVGDLRRPGNITPTLLYQLARPLRSLAVCLAEADTLSVHVSSA
jgi:hypothetical protein